MATAVAGVLMVAMTWSLLRVAWFVHTSAWCGVRTCRAGAVDEEMMVQGEQALRAWGATDLTIAFTYLPLTVVTMGVVVALLASAALLWWGSPTRWRGRWQERAATGHAPIVRTAQALVVGFVLVWVVNWPSLLWVTHVTE